MEWLKATIEEKKKSSQSYDDYIDEKFGKVITFNTKSDKDLFEPNKAMVTSVTPAHFAERTKKSK